jgi:outer membrane protein TolC
MEKKWILFFIIPILNIPAFAEDPSPILPSLEPRANRLTLESLLMEAREKNPEILATREEWQAAKARVPQMRSLPNPMVSYMLRNSGNPFDEITIGDDMMSMQGISATQKIPFPTKLFAKGRAASEMANRVEEIARGTELNVLAKLKMTFYDLYFAHQSIETITKNKDLLMKFEKTAEVRYAVGKGIQQDVLKAQVEVSRLLEKLELLKEKKGRSEAMINSLLVRPIDSPLGRPEEITLSPFKWTLEELNGMALQAAPALKAVEHVIESNEARLALSKWEYLPDFTISAGRMDRGDFPEIWTFNVGVSLPIYFWTKETYGVRESRSNLASTRQNYENVKQRVLFQVKDLYLRATTASRLVDLIGSGIIPQASLALESAISGYEVGKVDFLTLLNNFITLLNDELEYYAELVDYEKALAQMEAVVGVELN